MLDCSDCPHCRRDRIYALFIKFVKAFNKELESSKKYGTLNRRRNRTVIKDLISKWRKYKEYDDLDYVLNFKSENNAISNCEFGSDALKSRWENYIAEWCDYKTHVMKYGFVQCHIWKIKNPRDGKKIRVLFRMEDFAAYPTNKELLNLATKKNRVFLENNKIFAHVLL